MHNMYGMVLTTLFTERISRSGGILSAFPNIV